MKCRTIEKVDGHVEVVWFRKSGSFSDKQQAVADSLTQRLSVFKKELWYNPSYGLPLFDKNRSKVLLDATIANEVLAHSDVVQIDQFNSHVTSGVYHCDMKIKTVYGSIQVSI